MSALKLSAELLLTAYIQGVFPMAHKGELYWYDPDPRAILPLDQFHVPRRLKRTIKRVSVLDETGQKAPFVNETPRQPAPELFEIRVNSAFGQTIQHCADPQRPGAWINAQIIRAYNQLNYMGWAHSVETWQDGRLVGGLYGVAIRGLFAGEAMFSHVTDASKVALVYLIEHLNRRGFTLLDVQFNTPHLSRFGVIDVSRDDYQQRLAHALQQDVLFEK